MPTVVVCYPRGAGSTFDFDYYRQTHLPLVARHWKASGLVKVSALQGTPGPDGSDGPYLAIALLAFGSEADIASALGGPHAPEIMGDIVNFTNVEPVIQMTTEVAFDG
jgi:uncharacterized protein (TIGR02118 family)